MTDKYLLGLISAKTTKLFSISDYEMLKEFNKDEIIEYLYNLNFIGSKLKSFEDNTLTIFHNLKDEIEKYLTDEHLIYKYFFDNDNNLDKTNEIYSEINNKGYNLEFYSKFHIVKNIITMFRLNELNLNVEDLNRNLLDQNEMSNELLKKSFNLGKNEIIKITKELLNITVDYNLNIVDIEKLLNDYFYDYAKKYSYSSELSDLIAYYIYRNIKQIEMIKSIYYLGEL